MGLCCRASTELELVQQVDDDVEQRGDSVVSEWVRLNQKPGKRISDQSEAKKVTAVCVSQIISYSPIGSRSRMGVWLRRYRRRNYEDDMG